MITSNVIHRVFRVRFGGATGTAFAIDVDGRQYLVTAKHVIDTLADEAQLDVYANGGWTALPVKLVGHAPADTDVSAMATNRRMTPGPLPLEPSQDGLIYGQDVYFLGFPYNILSRYVSGTDGFPLPLAKRALLSCFEHDLLLLDGHNNPGFSGGPVVFTEANRRDFKVAAVVSGFQAVEEPVYESGQKTPLVYMHNTGITVAYSISHAVSLIRANPIGYQLGTA